MAKYTIYGVGHTEEVPVIRYSGAPAYHGTYLKPAYLEFSSISSPTLINWQIGDYIIYDRTGYTYKLYDIPQPTKKAVTGGRGEAYVYSNVQFYCATKELEICPFRDLVYKDSAYHFSTLNSVNTYENVAGIASRIKANLVNLFGNTWDVVVASGLSGFDETEAREFSTSGANCLEALDKVYEVWPDLGWTFSIVNGVYTITIGGANIRSSANTTNKYEYGINKGLTMIKKTQANKDDFCTRLYVYGSNRNILSRYYNDLLDADGQHIYQYESVHIPNLMIPLTSWGKTSGKYDASKAYLENATAQAQYGLIPKAVYFDGTEDEEIFPSIKGVTIGELRNAKSSTATGAPNYYPSASIYTDSSARIDELVSVASPSDDGDIGSSGSKYIEESSETISATSATYEIPASSAISLHTIAVSNILSHTFTQTGKVTLSTECVFSVTALGEPTSVGVKCYIKNGDNTTVSTIDLEGTKSGNVWTFPLAFTAGSVTKLMTGNVHLDLVLNLSYGALASAVTVTYGKTAASATWGLSRILTKTFTATIRQIGFDMMARAALSGNGNPSIAFTDGACVGREFVVKSATYNSVADNWSLVLYRGDDTSVNMRYPNTNYPVVSGNHFVILDIAMPSEYVGMASQKLLTKGTALMQKCSKVEPFFEPSVNAKKVIENITEHPGTESYILREGKYMYISDSDVVGTDEYVIIDTLTINENEANIPTYKVTLRERKRQSFAQSIEASLSSLTSTSSGSSVSSSGGSGGGVSDYSELENKPSINSVVIDGAMSAYDDLGLITKDFFELDTASIAGTTLIKAKYGLYSDQQITAGGLGSGGGSIAVAWGTASGGKQPLSVSADERNLMLYPATEGTTGQVLTKTATGIEWANGGGSGVTAYINGVLLSGNKTTEQIRVSFKGTRAQWNALSSDEKRCRFAVITDEVAVPQLHIALSVNSTTHKLKAQLYDITDTTLVGESGEVSVQEVIGYTPLDSDDFTFAEIGGSLAASQVPSLDWSKIATGKPTTISGYGITDAKIENGVITLGNNTITPLTTGSQISASQIQETADRVFVTPSQKSSLAQLATMFELDSSSGVVLIKARYGLYSNQQITAGGVGTGGGSTAAAWGATSGLSQALSVSSVSKNLMLYPTGGNTGQVLSKTDSGIEWADVSSGNVAYLNGVLLSGNKTTEQVRISFKGTRTQWNALSSDERKCRFAVITDEAAVPQLHIALVVNASTGKLKAQLWDVTDTTLVGESGEVEVQDNEALHSGEFVDSIPSGQSGAGKHGIKFTKADGTIVYIALEDSSDKLITAADTATIANKTISADSNTISDLAVSNFKSSSISTSIPSTSAVDTKLPTEKAVRTALSAKQDTISDLESIRNGANLGRTSVQPATLANYLTIASAAATYQVKITSDNKLSSDLVDDTNHTNKFVTASDKELLTKLGQMFSLEEPTSGTYRIKANYGLYSESFITAGGLGSGGTITVAWGSTSGLSQALSVAGNSKNLMLYPSGGNTGQVLAKTTGGVGFSDITVSQITDIESWISGKSYVVNPSYTTGSGDKYLKRNGTTLSWSDVSTGTLNFNELTNRPKYNGSAMTGSTNIPEVPDALSDLTDDATHRLVTDTEKSTWSGKQDALGYTAFNAANFTEANIKSTLGISNWALEASKPSYAFSELSAHPTTISGYGITDAKIENGIITLGGNTITPQAKIDSSNLLSASLISETTDRVFVTSAQKTSIAELISMFELDTASISGTTLIKAKFGLYSNQQITAGGVGSGSSTAVSWGTESLGAQALSVAGSSKNLILYPTGGSTGQVLKKTASGVAWADESGSGGTTDFEALSNRPKYNGVLMTGSTDIPEVKTSTWDAKQDAISDLATIRSGAAAGSTALQSVPDTYRTAAQQDAIHDSTKQDVISDLSTIRSNAEAGAAKVSCTEAVVAGFGFTKNTGTYSKPSAGIPLSDLESSVQTSLGKADTALQDSDDIAAALGYYPASVNEITKAKLISKIGIKNWALAASKPSYAFSEIISCPTTITGYGITDAKIENGVITLGSNTITPLVASDISDMATKTWVGNQSYLTTSAAASTYQTKISASNLLSASLIEETAGDTGRVFVTPAQKASLADLISMFTKEVDSTQSSGYRIKANFGLYSNSFITAGGIGDGVPPVEWGTAEGGKQPLSIESGGVVDTRDLMLYPEAEGTEGQVLLKTNTGIAWGTGDIMFYPETAGTEGQALVKTSTGIAWGQGFNPENEGQVGQVLMKTSTGFAWTTI